MKKIVSLLSFCLTLSSAAYSDYQDHHQDHHHDHHHEHHCDNQDYSYLNFDVYSQEYTFTTIFDFVGKNDFLGTIAKSVFNVRTHYDIYDIHGKYQGTGICRLLTLGAIYDWAREIDVWGANDEYVGMIDGQVATGAKAKYSLYNGTGSRVGIAYLEKGCTAFVINHPDNEYHKIAYLKRHFIPDEKDHWSITVFDENAIDLRIIKVFAAFALDSQNSFKEDI